MFKRVGLWDILEVDFSDSSVRSLNLGTPPDDFLYFYLGQSKGEIADHQLVTVSQAGCVADSFPVDPDAIHTVEVTNDKAIIDERDTAVLPGNLSAVLKNDVAVGMPTDQKDRFVEDDRATALVGFEQNCHATSHSYRLRWRRVPEQTA